MVHRPGTILLSFLLAASALVLFAIGASGQIASTNQNSQARMTTVVGILRRISDDALVVEAGDKRIVTLALGITTKFYKASGAMMRAADLQPGDRLSIDATQDDNAFYHARNVNQVKVGTPAERAAASQPVETSPIAPIGKGGNSGGGNSGSASARDHTEPHVPPDPNDSGPPKLKRGVPQPGSGPPLVAQNDPPPASRPSIHADEVNGVTRTPDAPKIDAAGRSGAREDGDGGPQRHFGSSGDPVIDQAREAAYSFSETLPNYVVKQFTTRYETEAARGGKTSWHAIDLVTADVVSEGGKESYKNILVNGKPPKEDVEKSGSWSTGEYASVLLDILSSSTDADFHNKRSTTIVSRSAWRYDFSVEQPHSHWHVYASAESYQPEYTGEIWIDKENSRVLRVELSARNMPKAFPLDTVESAVDYDYVLIGDSKFLLPVHSEALSCERGTSLCSRNVIDFRNYKKFGADTSITFDAPDR